MLWLTLTISAPGVENRPIGFLTVTLLLWIVVVDKGSVRVPTVTYVGGRFADMDLGGQSGHFGYGS